MKCKCKKVDITSFEFIRESIDERLLKKEKDKTGYREAL